jgi:hypothetical protein
MIDILGILDVLEVIGRILEDFWKQTQMFYIRYFQHF